MQLKYEDIIKEVNKVISVAGKHTTDTNGKVMFTQSTMSEKELPVVKGYILNAIVTICSDMQYFISKQKANAHDYIITLDLPANHKEVKEKQIEEGVTSYVTLYSCALWFTTIGNEALATKYGSDADSARQYVLNQLTMIKDRPKESKHHYAKRIDVWNLKHFMNKDDELIFSTAMPGLAKPFIYAREMLNAIKVNESVFPRYTFMENDVTNIVDDIRVKSNNDNVEVGFKNDFIFVKGKKHGVSCVTIYSYHNPSAFAQILFLVQ